ncbi:hypothetical protein AAF712_012910 [Marasmius tenuissimus]|uniref:t-SNARE coiled-coil homology domain-containing protein n=1 Tax=Marasmius tenuissimus TaxID=585030 RepID=A0ABR2ZF71_9AGAR
MDTETDSHIEYLQALIEKFETAVDNSQAMTKHLSEGLGGVVPLLQTQFPDMENRCLLEQYTTKINEWITTQNPWAHAMHILLGPCSELLSFMREDRIRRQEDARAHSRAAHLEVLLSQQRTIFSQQQEELAKLRAAELQLGEYEASIAAFERLGVFMRPDEVAQYHQPILHSDIFARLVSIQDGLQAQQAIMLDDAHTKNLARENEELEESLQRAHERAEAACVFISARQRRKIAFNAICKFVLTVTVMLFAAYITHLRARGSF